MLGRRGLLRFLMHNLIEVMLRVLQSQEILRLRNISLSLPIINYGGLMGDITVYLFDELVAERLGETNITSTFVLVFFSTAIFQDHDI